MVKDFFSKIPNNYKDIENKIWFNMGWGHYGCNGRRRGRWTFVDRVLQVLTSNSDVFLRVFGQP
jgi:hypothetical protein